MRKARDERKEEQYLNIDRLHIERDDLIARVIGRVARVTLLEGRRSNVIRTTPDENL
jgi:hypothetical protein